jgi:hypothetical protein
LIIALLTERELSALLETTAPSTMTLKTFWMSLASLKLTGKMVRGPTGLFALKNWMQ